MKIEDHLADRQTFAQWRASQRTLVGVGDFIDDYGDWLVFPEITYCERQATTLDESNWQIVSDALADSEDAVEWSADHWVTSYAFYCARPGSDAAIALEGFVCALADYPVLCDSHFSALECEHHSDDSCDEHCSFCESARSESRVFEDDSYSVIGEGGRTYYRSIEVRTPDGDAWFRYESEDPAQDGWELTEDEYGFDNKTVQEIAEGLADDAIAI